MPQGIVWEQRFYPVDDASATAQRRTSVTLRLRVVPQGFFGKLTCFLIMGLVQRSLPAAVAGELSDQIEEAYRVQREEGKTMAPWAVVQKDGSRPAPKLGGFVAQRFGPLDEGSEGLAVLWAQNKL